MAAARVAAGLLRDPVAAQDVVQEAFERLRLGLRRISRLLAEAGLLDES